MKRFGVIFCWKDVSWILKHNYPKHPFPSWKNKLPHDSLLRSFREFEKDKVVEYLLENERKSNIPSKNWWSPVCGWNFPFKMVPFQGQPTNSSVFGPVNRWPNQLSPWAGVHRGYLHKASVVVDNVVDGPLPGSCSPIFSLTQRIHFSHGPLGAFGPSMLNVEGSHNRDHIYIGFRTVVWRVPI